MADRTDLAARSMCQVFEEAARRLFTLGDGLHILISRIGSAARSLSWAQPHAPAFGAPVADRVGRSTVHERHLVAPFEVAAIVAERILIEDVLQNYKRHDPESEQEKSEFEDADSLERDLRHRVLHSIAVEDVESPVLAARAVLGDGPWSE